MADWLTWPADLLLGIGAIVASWFVSEDKPNFVVIQMMVATLVLAAIVGMLVYGQSLIGYCQSVLRARRTKRAP